MKKQSVSIAANERIGIVEERNFPYVQRWTRCVLFHRRLISLVSQAQKPVVLRLRSRVLYFNRITENLQYLRLGDNNLHSVPSDALRRLHRLRHLDLKANNITVLPEDAFTGYGDSITFLNLQKNL